MHSARECQGLHVPRISLMKRRLPSCRNKAGSEQLLVPDPGSCQGHLLCPRASSTGGARAVPCASSGRASGAGQVEWDVVAWPRQ